MLAVACSGGEKKDLVVGVIGSMTGGASFLGESEKYGLEIAAEEINAAGGILGRKITLVYRDDESNVDKGVTVARDLVEREKVEVIMGPAISHVAYAVVPVVNEYKVINIPQLGITGIADATKSPYTFRGAWTDRMSMAKVANWLVNTKKVKKIGVVYENSAWGTGLRDDLKAELSPLGVTPVAEQASQPGATDFTPQLTAMKNAGAEAVVAAALFTELAKIVKDRDKLGMNIPVVGHMTSTFPAFRQLAGESIKEVYSYLPKAVAFAPGGDIPAKSKAFLDKVATKFGNTRTDQPQLTGQYYDALYLYSEAVKKAGSTDSAKVKVAFEGISGYQGLMDTYKFGPTQHDGSSNPLVVLKAFKWHTDPKYGGTFETAE